MQENQKRADTLHDIEERRKIISNFRITGYLDRDEAVKKIKELRVTNESVGKVTAIRLAQSATPFQNTSNESLVAELEMQLQILEIEINERD